MALKFCPNCGNKLEGITKFCPNCGAKLEGSPETESIQSETPKNKNTFNVNAPVPNSVAGSGGLKKDYREGRILEYKRAMGIDSGIDNVLVSQVANVGKIMILGSLAALTEHWYILSFEDNGIVLIGMSKGAHFTGKNVFIPSSEIEDISYHKGLAKKVLTIVHSGSKLKMYISYTLLGSPFQSNNYKNLDALISKYK